MQFYTYPFKDLKDLSLLLFKWLIAITLKHSLVRWIPCSAETAIHRGSLSYSIGDDRRCSKTMIGDLKINFSKTTQSFIWFKQNCAQPLKCIRKLLESAEMLLSERF